MKKSGTDKKGSGAKRRAAPRDVDEYLAAVPEPARSTLAKVRAAIRSAAPRQAVEIISYRIPALRYKAVVVWYAAFADHCSLFPTASIVEAFKRELEDYTISKGTIQFPTDRPLPAALVRKIVKARIAQIESKKPRSESPSRTK